MLTTYIEHYTYQLIIYTISSIGGLFFYIFALKETKGKNQKKIWEAYGINFLSSFFKPNMSQTLTSSTTGL